jgi:hypothetical protein
MIETFQENRLLLDQKRNLRPHYTKDNRILGLENHDFLYATPNEKGIKDLSEKLFKTKFNPEVYIGIIGGVLANFNYIGALDYKNEVYLIDVNNRAIDHLAFFLYCLPENGSYKKFIENIHEKKIDTKEIEELFGKDIEGDLPDFSLYSEKNRNHIALEVNSFIFNQWNIHLNRGMEIMYKNIRENKVIAFRADINKEGLHYVNSIIEKARSSFLYLSDVALDYNFYDKLNFSESFLVIHQNYKRNNR